MQKTCPRGYTGSVKVECYYGNARNQNNGDCVPNDCVAGTKNIFLEKKDDFAS